MAEFIAAAQVLVYIGAVGILLLFAIMLTERVTGEGKRIFSRGWLGGALASFAVLGALLLPPLRATVLPAHAQPVDPSVRALGEQLMNPYVVTLEVLALLLTAALIGAVATAQGTAKRKGAAK